MEQRIPLLVLLCALLAVTAVGGAPAATNASVVIDGQTWETAAQYTNSLPYHLATNAVLRTTGIEIPAAAMPYLYSNGSGSRTFYQYKPFQARWTNSCWLAGVTGLGATCLGYTNGHGGVYPITMVSPRHYLAAGHIASWFPFCAGKDMAVFLDRDNVVHYRSSLQCTNADNDIAVGILDSDLPDSVGFLPVLPRNYTNYVSTTNWVQGIGANQDLLVFSQPIQLTATPGAFWRSSAPILFGLSTNWSRSIRMGDSSFPERLLIGNQLVLVSCNSGAGGGANYAQSADTINRLMHYLSTNNNLRSDYQLTTVDLSRFAQGK